MCFQSAQLFASFPIRRGFLIGTSAESHFAVSLVASEVDPKGRFLKNVVPREVIVQEVVDEGPHATSRLNQKVEEVVGVQSDAGGGPCVTYENGAIPLDVEECGANRAICLLLVLR